MSLSLYHLLRLRGLCGLLNTRLVFTHCEPTIELGDVFKHYTKVYTTDSMHYALQTKKADAAEKICIIPYGAQYPYGGEMSVDEMRATCNLPAKEERGCAG